MAAARRPSAAPVRRALEDTLTTVYSRAARLALADVGVDPQPGFNADNAAVRRLAKARSGQLFDRVFATAGRRARNALAAELKEAQDPGAVAEALRKRFDGVAGRHARTAVRTEIRDLYNTANLDAWSAVGVRSVIASDGHGGLTGETDAACLARNGKRYTVAQARNLAHSPVTHPNCTISFQPFVPKGGLRPPADIAAALEDACELRLAVWEEARHPRDTEGRWRAIRRALNVPDAMRDFLPSHVWDPPPGALSLMGSHEDRAVGRGDPYYETDAPEFQYFTPAESIPAVRAYAGDDRTMYMRDRGMPTYHMTAVPEGFAYPRGHFLNEEIRSGRWRGEPMWADAVRDLDAAFASAPKNTEPVYAYRGLPGSVLAGLGPGDYFHDRAYQSLTTDRGQAGFFAMMAGDNPMVAVISLPPGTPALVGTDLEQQELILMRDARYRIDRIEGALVYLTYIPRGASSDIAVPPAPPWEDPEYDDAMFAIPDLGGAAWRFIWQPGEIEAGYFRLSWDEERHPRVPHGPHGGEFRRLLSEIGYTLVDLKTGDTAYDYLGNESTVTPGTESFLNVGSPSTPGVKLLGVRDQHGTIVGSVEYEVMDNLYSDARVFVRHIYVAPDHRGAAGFAIMRELLRRHPTLPIYGAVANKKLGELAVRRNERLRERGVIAAAAMAEDELLELEQSDDADLTLAFDAPAHPRWPRGTPGRDRHGHHLAGEFIDGSNILDRLREMAPFLEQQRPGAVARVFFRNHEFIPQDSKYAAEVSFEDAGGGNLRMTVDLRRFDESSSEGLGGYRPAFGSASVDASKATPILITGAVRAIEAGEPLPAGWVIDPASPGYQGRYLPAIRPDVFGPQYHVGGLVDFSSVVTMPGPRSRFYRPVRQAVDDVDRVVRVPDEHSMARPGGEPLGTPRFGDVMVDGYYGGRRSKSGHYDRWYHPPTGRSIPLAVMFEDGLGLPGSTDTLLHEIGHHFDYELRAARVEDVPRIKAARDALNVAIKDSPEVKQLRAYLVRGAKAEYTNLRGETVRIAPDKKHVKYLVQDDELWARAFAQYVAEKSGDPFARAYVHNAAAEQAVANVKYQRQWLPEDFAPISAAFDNLFHELGWDEGVRRPAPGEDRLIGQEILDAARAEVLRATEDRDKARAAFRALQEIPSTERARDYFDKRDRARTRLDKAGSYLHRVDRVYELYEKQFTELYPAPPPPPPPEPLEPRKWELDPGTMLGILRQPPDTPAGAMPGYTYGELAGALGLVSPSTPPAPESGPMAEMFVPELDGRAKAYWDAALAAIGRVHGYAGWDPDFPRIKVPVREVEEQETGTGVIMGGYTGTDALGTPPRRIPLYLSFTTTGDEDTRSIIVHEIGHIVERNMLGNGVDVGVDLDTPGWRAYRAAVEASPEIGRLRGRLPTVTLKHPLFGLEMPLPPDQAHVDYLLDASEVWARAYSQYIATKSGDPNLIRDLTHQERRFAKGEAYPYPLQWSEESFAPIAAAMDQIFRDAGWPLHEQAAAPEAPAAAAVPSVTLKRVRAGWYASEDGRYAVVKDETGWWYARFNASGGLAEFTPSQTRQLSGRQWSKKDAQKVVDSHAAAHPWGGPPVPTAEPEPSIPITHETLKAQQAGVVLAEAERAALESYVEIATTNDPASVDAAIRKAGPLPGDAVVYRGAMIEAFGVGRYDAIYDRTLPAPGDTFTVPYFTSTSLREDIAELFRGLAADAYEGQASAIARITVPRGTHAAYVPALLPDGTYSGDDPNSETDQYELLLPRGSEIRIDNVEVDSETGVVYIDATLISEGPYVAGDGSTAEGAASEVGVASGGSAAGVAAGPAA